MATEMPAAFDLSSSLSSSSSSSSQTDTPDKNPHLSRYLDNEKAFLSENIWVSILLERMRESRDPSNPINLNWPDPSEDGFDATYREFRAQNKHILPDCTPISVNDTRMMIVVNTLWFAYQMRYKDMTLPNHKWAMLISRMTVTAGQTNFTRLLESITSKMVDQKILTKDDVAILTNYSLFPTYIRDQSVSRAPEEVEKLLQNAKKK